MKLFAVILAGLMMAGPALGQSVEAPGKITYKMFDQIVTRDATLVVPARGQGDVILKGENSEIVAERFFSDERNGRVIFYVVFDDFPGSTPETKSVFRGTYLRGDNMALYWGDVFLYNVDSDPDLLAIDSLDTDGDFEHVAGFMFKTEIR